jgi:2-iminobutanoate/2-iminopropanoate deaminase
MAKQIIRSDKVLPPGLPLSQAVRTGDLVFVSGITPFTKEREVAAGDFEAQMRQVLENITHILAEAGTSLDKAVKVTVVLVRISDFDEMNRIYREYFEDGNYPARITIEAPLAHPDFLLEIECIAEM